MNKHHSFAPIVAAVLLLVPVLYVGSYLVLVVPEGRHVRELTKNGVRFYHCRYRINSKDLLPTVFYPLEEIDLKLRSRAQYRENLVQPRKIDSPPD
jgi:hypothetical protein